MHKNDTEHSPPNSRDPETFGAACRAMTIIETAPRGCPSLMSTIERLFHEMALISEATRHSPDAP